MSDMINGRTPEEIMRKMECFKRFLQKKCSDEKYCLFEQIKLCGKCELLNADYKCDDAIMDLYEYTKQLEERRRAEWEEPYKNDIWDCYQCTACGHKGINKTKFCPNCGAKMDAEVSNDA